MYPFRPIAIALLLLAQTAVASAATTCPGPDPAIVSVVVRSVVRDGGLHRYHLAGTVTNAGGTAQAGNTLQFVDIFENGIKLDERGVPALKVGQSYTFTYTSSRSRQAGKGTTELTFQLDVRHPSPTKAQDCNRANDRYTLRF